MESILIDNVIGPSGTRVLPSQAKKAGKGRRIVVVKDSTNPDTLQFQIENDSLKFRVKQERKRKKTWMECTIIKQVLVIITMLMAYGSLWWSIEVERIGKMESEEGQQSGPDGAYKWREKGVNGAREAQDSSIQRK